LRILSGTPPIVAHPIVASLVLLIAYGAAAETNLGAKLAATCASCHHQDGRDEGIPSIVGWDEESLVSAMRLYKSGDRKSQPMHAIATSFSDDEIIALARHLAARKRERERQ
jgi:sulfide dehydrogenase cytochrome subunit